MWLFYATGTVTPVSTAAGDIITYILSFGVLGVVALALAFRFIVPRSAVDEATAQARRDLLRENERLITEKAETQAKLDAALKIAQEQLVPMLGSFVATSQSLIPLLQELVRNRER